MADAPATYTCQWCRAVSSAANLISCPTCGAPVDVRAVVSRSGWYELPAIRDMARIQFGLSRIQIEGALVPVADVNLVGDDSVYFTHHVLLWKDPAVIVSTMSMKGAWKRLFAGMPLIMTQAHGPGHIAFTRDAPGEMIALPLQPGVAIDVREHLWLVATGNVAYDWTSTGIWFDTRDDNSTERHWPLGMYMDRFSAPQTPGLVLVHAGGNAFVRGLAAGETILVKPTALIYKDVTVQMQLHFEQPGGTWSPWGRWGNRYLWLRLFGPGRVAVQSAFDRLEDPGTQLSGSSPATWAYW